jgi:hypothetical protein
VLNEISLNLFVLSVVEKWYYAQLKKAEMLVQNFGDVQGFQIVKQLKL